MWVRLDLEQAQPVFIVGCYIPHRGSNFYDRVIQVRRDDPMEDLEQEAAKLTGEGEVILIGDFNARTTSNQTDLSLLGITWEEEKNLGTD